MENWPCKFDSEGGEGLEVCISNNVLSRLPDPKLDLENRAGETQEARKTTARNESCWPLSQGKEWEQPRESVRENMELCEKTRVAVNSHF